MQIILARTLLFPRVEKGEEKKESLSKVKKERRRMPPGRLERPTSRLLGERYYH